MDVGPSELVDPWLWFEVDEHEDWMEFFFVRDNIGDRHRVFSILQTEGDGRGVLVDDFSPDEGVGLRIGLGWGLRQLLLLTAKPPKGVGLVANRCLIGEEERAQLGGQEVEIWLVDSLFAAWFVEFYKERRKKKQRKNPLNIYYIIG